MQQYLVRWSCGFIHNNCYVDFEVVYTFESVTQPSEHFCIANLHKATTHYKVSTSEYLPPDCTL